MIIPASPTKLLFVCSKNKWRSRTAETIYRNSSEYHVRSAGTSKTAQVKVTQALLDWAEVIFVMEPRHRDIIARHFSLPVAVKLHILHIPDEYPYGDAELIELLQDGVDRYSSID